MSRSTYFSQECPTCGRNLLIRVEYLGRTLVCQHCRGELYACDPASVRIDEAGYPLPKCKRSRSSNYCRGGPEMPVNGYHKGIGCGPDFGSCSRISEVRMVNLG